MELRLLALACLVGAAFAGPVQRRSENQGNRDEHEPGSKVRFQAGTSLYSYHSMNTISLGGTLRENVTIQATVEWIQVNRHEAYLKMKNPKIYQKDSPPGTDELSRKLEITLPFEYEEGKFLKVFPSPDESNESLNIKKGIMSSFVVPRSLRNATIKETDSLGECLTKCTVHHKNGETIHSKVKDPKTCSIEKEHVSLWKKILHVIDTEKLECTQRIQDGVIKSVKWQEKKRLRSPTESTKKWIEFYGSSELVLIETKPADKQTWQKPSDHLPEDIYYTIDKPRRGDGDMKEVERVLKKACLENEKVVHTSVNKDFMKVIHHVKSMSYKECVDVYELLKNGSWCSSKKVRDMYIDTLPAANTNATMLYMAKLMSNNEVSELTEKLWLKSLAVYGKPTVEILDALSPFMERKRESSFALFAVTSMINRLCSSENCREISAVRKFVGIYKKLLESGYSSGDEKQILTALRAFGNMGHHGEAHEQIVACAKDKSQPIRVRLAAIASFRNIHAVRPNDILRMYSDRNEDYEVRCSAFESIMEHADENQIEKVKQAAEAETNEQVSGFVYTYLQNLKKKKTPDRVKGLLQMNPIEAPKVAYWPNSKHVELSAYRQELKLGFSLRNKVINIPGTTIPKSIDSTMHVNWFGENINVVELGVRIDHPEDLWRKIKSIKNIIPKIEEIRERIARNLTFEEIKEEFKHLFQNKIFLDISTELSGYLGLGGIRVTELSTSDLSGMKQMLKIAELISKLAHGQKADFSQSVPLVNSKLVIPSITGRSYSIIMEGSSTVGLTAETRADLMNFPEKGDAHLHFQPSFSTEIVTRAAIDSNKECLKVVARIYGKSNAEIKLKGRDHDYKLQLILPDEKIASVNISTDIVGKNEKSIFGELQDKIDYCSKPVLGLTGCVILKTTKGLITGKFPYITPVMNAEINVKKSSNFSHFELGIKSSEKTSSSRKWTVYFDRSGSSDSKLIALDIIKTQVNDRSNVSIKLTSTLTHYGASCSVAKDDRRVEVFVNLHKNKKEIVSTNITSIILKSRSREVYELRGSYSIRNQERANVSGTIMLKKGRGEKKHLSIDVKTNSKQTEPMALKAIFMKDGSMQLSQNEDLRLSSELSLKTPLLFLSLRKAIEIQSKTTPLIFGRLGIDYQLKGKEKQSFEASGKSQISSSTSQIKRNTVINFKSTEYLRENLQLTWDLQRESNESFTNDIKLIKGQEKPCFRFIQKSHIPENGPGHCSATLEMPQRDIYYEVKVDHHIVMSEIPTFSFGVLIGDKQGKRLDASMKLNYESISPMKATTELKWEYADSYFSYKDEIKETVSGLEGNIQIQCRKKEYKCSYAYNKLSSDSKLHHMIESSIHSPSLRDPISVKASIESKDGYVDLVGEIEKEYKVEVHLIKYGVSHINIKSPIIEGIVKSTKEDEKTEIYVDMKLKTGRYPHYIGSVNYELGDENKLEMRLNSVIDHKTKRLFSFSTSVKHSTSGDSKNMILSTFDFEIPEISFSIKETAEVYIFGDYKLKVEFKRKNQEPIVLIAKRETGEEHGKMTFHVTTNGESFAKLVMESSLNKEEFAIKVTYTSSNYSYKYMHMYLKNKITSLNNSKIVQTNISFKKNEMSYETEWNSDIQPNGLEVKAQMKTPHENYKKNAVGFSVQVTDDEISSSVSIDCFDSKRIFIHTVCKTKPEGISFVGKLNSSFEIVKQAEAQFKLLNHRSKKSVEANLDINHERVCDLEGSLKQSEIVGSLKFSKAPLPSVDITLQKSISHALVSIKAKKMNKEEIYIVSEVRDEGNVKSTTTEVRTPYKNFQNIKLDLSAKIDTHEKEIKVSVDANGERKGDAAFIVTTTSQSTEVKVRVKTVRTAEISADVKLKETGKSLFLSANVMKGVSPTRINRLSYHDEELMKANTVLNLEISMDVSDKNTKKCSVSLRGPCSPVSLSVSMKRNKKNSFITQLSACREEDCYFVKSYYENLSNSTKNHKQITLDLEKSSGGQSVPLGRVKSQLILSSNELIFKSYLEKDGKKIGHDLKLQARKHPHDSCFLDYHIYLPDSTSRFRCAVFHGPNLMKFELDAIPNTDYPSRKLNFEMKKEINSATQETSLLFKMGSPHMSTPIVITGKCKEVGEFVYLKFVVRPGPWGSVWIAEVVPNLEQEAYGIRSIKIQVYDEHDKFHAGVTFFGHRSSRENRFGWEWTCNEERGGVTLVISKKDGGKHAQILYFSPSSDYQLQGSVAQSPGDINFSIGSGGKKLKEMRISVFDSCVNTEVGRYKGRFCFYKQQDNEVQLINVQVTHNQHKVVDILLKVNLDEQEYIEGKVQVDKQRLRRALKDLMNNTFLKFLSLEELEELKIYLYKEVRQLKQKCHEKTRKLKEDLHRKARQIKQDILEPHLEKIRKYLDHLTSKYDECEKMIQEIIRKLKAAKEDILNHILDALPSIIKEICQRYYETYRSFCLKLSKLRNWTLSEIGRYCSHIKSTISSFHAKIKEAKMHVDRKWIQMNRNLKSWIIGPTDITNFIRYFVKTVHQYIMDTFGGFLGGSIMNEIRKFAAKIEEIVREKSIEFIDKVIKKFHNILSSDEDLRTLKELIVTAKNKVIKAWKNKEEIAEVSVKQIKNNFRQNLKSLLDKEFKLQIDSNEGEYKFRVRQILTKEDIEILRHGFDVLLSKLQAYLNRNRYY